MPRRLVLPALVLLVLAAAACEARTTVDVAVAEDGSGEVAVTLHLDGAALRRVPDLDADGTSGPADLAGLVRRDDLVAAGWRVDDPVEESGGASLTVRRAFGTPGEAELVLAELTGPGGALRDLRVTRSAPFGRTELGFSGTADLSGGLEAFGDEGLAAALEGQPLGQDVAAMEAAIGAPLAEAATFEITADLDGEVTSWSPRLGDPPVAMAARATVPDVPVLVLAAVAVGATAALVAVLVARAVRSGRRA